MKPCWELDMDGMVVNHNAHARELLGLDAEDVNGKKVYEFAPRQAGVSCMDVVLGKKDPNMNKLRRVVEEGLKGGKMHAKVRMTQHGDLDSEDDEARAPCVMELNMFSQPRYDKD